MDHCSVPSSRFSAYDHPAKSSRRVDVKKLMVMTAALSLVGVNGNAVASAEHSAVERIVRHYESTYRGGTKEDEQVGETVFYCDGSSETQGLVTAYEHEEYYGCS